MFEAKLTETRGNSVGLYRRIAFTFLGLTLIAIVVILYFSLASATITIRPVKTDFPVDYLITASPFEDDKVSFNDGEAVSKGRLLEATKESTKEFPTSVVSAGEPGKAKGMVTLVNDSASAQALVVKTRLLTKEGVLYRMTKGATVPANGQLDVEVMADAAGEASDYAETAAIEFTIPGLNADRQKQVYARSKGAMTGGIKYVKIFTDADLKKAEEEFAEFLAKQAALEWEADLPAGLKFLDNSVYHEVTASQADAKTGEKVDNFKLTLKVRAAGLAGLEKDIVALGLAKLKKAVSGDNELVTFDDDSFSYSAEKYDAPSQTLSLRLNLVGKTQVRSTSPVFDRSKLAGLAAPDAKKYLEGLEGVAGVEISLSPPWLKKLPTLKDHIRIVIEK